MAEAGPSQGGAEGGQVNTKQDLINYLDAQGVEAMFAVEPRKNCEHLNVVAPLPECGLNVNDPCEVCGNIGENWVCLVCYKVYCSRYVKGHMVEHGKEADHPVVLSYSDMSVWCYKCDDYLENEILEPALVSARLSKFGSG